MRRSRVAPRRIVDPLAVGLSALVLRAATSLVVTVTPLLGAGIPGAAAGQMPAHGEVRQLVSFTLRPGAAPAVREIYRDELLALYRADPEMRSLRVFREAESAVPVDLVVVRAFDGMAGMDASGEALRGLASESGTSVGALYGRISALSTGHTDEFVRMVPGAGEGDPAAAPLTAVFRFRIVPGRLDAMAEALAGPVRIMEREGRWAASTGRVLLGDGWHLVRMVGLSSLGDYQSYVERLERALDDAGVADSVAARSDQLLVAIPELAVRE